MHSRASLLKYMTMAAAVAAVPLATRAQDDANADWNHFGADFTMGLNIQTKFTHPGSIPPPIGAGGAVNRDYNDGYVDVDISGNAGNKTWNWGYQNANQINGNTLSLHASSGGGTLTDNSDPNLGFDLNYARDLGHTDWGRWGFKVALGYTRINVKDDQSLNGQNITDQYNLGGIMPPNAPYSGNAKGPGVLINSIPTSRTSDPILITGSRSLDATVGDFRLGPFVDFNLTKRLSLELGGGLDVGLVDSTFTFSETAVGQATVTGDNKRTECLAGGYAEAGFAYRIWHSASIYAGAQFQYLGDFQQSEAGRGADLDLTQSVFCKIGLQWSF
jgi:hypothetical protein